MACGENCDGTPLSSTNIFEKLIEYVDDADTR
jgi:hypothetical protein